MVSFAETVERQRARAAEENTAPVQEDLRLHGEQPAQDAFARKQLMGLLDEVVDFAHSDGHLDARWYFFMESHSIAVSALTPDERYTTVKYLPSERPVALLQWSEQGSRRRKNVGFRLTLEQPDYDRLIVGTDYEDGVYVVVGDEKQMHIYDVIAAQYDNAKALRFPYPAILAS